MKANVLFESLALLEGTGEERLHPSRVSVSLIPPFYSFRASLLRVQKRLNPSVLRQ